jgi:O-antigen/teichoic acid export membrane protein
MEHVRKEQVPEDKGALSTSVRGIPSGLSLRANFSWTLVGNVVFAAAQWGWVIVLAKLVSPEKVGQFALGLAIASPVMMFASLRMRVVQATDATQEYRFGDYLGLRLITAVLAVLVIAGIAFVSGYEREVAAVILVIGLWKVTGSISDVFYGLLQQHDRMDGIAKSLMIKGPVELAALGTLVYLTGSVFWGVMGILAFSTLVLVFYDIRNGAFIMKSVRRLGDKLPGGRSRDTSLRPRWEMKTLTRLAWLLLPLGFVTMLTSLHSNIPRYFVERHLGGAELGIFAAVAYFHNTGIIVVNALGQSASPRLSRFVAAGKPASFRKLLFRLTGIAALLGVGGVLVAFVAGREILTVFYQPEYARRDLFVLIMAASAMAYVASCLAYGLTAARYLRVQMLLSLAVTVVLVLACFWLIPSRGLLGAAVALLIARSVHALGSLVVTGHALRALNRQMVEASETQ